MDNNWRYTEDVIEEFKIKYKNRVVDTDDAVLMDINPERIVAINNIFNYPDILNDYKMKRLRKSYEENGWINNHKGIGGFCFLMLPNGDLLVNGGGNHRAVLVKEEGLKSVKAIVNKVKFID